MGDPKTCQHCGEPIGVYEPVVVVAASAPGSLAPHAEGAVRPAPGSSFHLECWLAAVRPAAA